MRLTKHKKEDEIRGLFFVLKGQYSKNRGMDSYDPDSDQCKDHYILLDNKVFNTIASGNTLEKVLGSLEVAIKKYKTQDRYFKMLDTYTNEDYYRVHYQGLPPYTPEESDKILNEGRRCRVSLAMKRHYQEAYELYGDYFREECKEVEDRVYDGITFQTPLERSRRLMKGKPTLSTKKSEETPKKHLRGLSKKKGEPKVKKGLVRKPVGKLSIQ